MSCNTPSDASSESRYDQVPYPSWPYAQSHPDRMAAVATLLGLNPPELERATILELGCAAGGNLIPIAEMYPNCRCLGLDLSLQQVTEGQTRIAALGLNNIEIRHQNILEFSRDEGPFDYLIAHGVYSWVPTAVQQRIFAICRDQLTRNGLAYISYNTYPGWRMRGMIRDMLVYHTRQFRMPQKQIEQARALLQFLAHAAATDTPYGALLKRELQLFERVSDEFIFHDHLEGVNTPVYFHEFMQQADGYDLQYLGEPELASMAASAFPKDVEETLHRISKDIIQVEQYMDFLKNRTFRQTILCRSHCHVDRSLAPEYVQRLWFASPLQEIETTSPDGTKTTAFRHKGLSVQTDRPALLGALRHLSANWPRASSFGEIVAAVFGSWPDSSRPSQELLEQELTDQLVQCYAAKVVEVHHTPPRVLCEIVAKPKSSRWARYQAMTEPKVTNARHEIVKLNPLMQLILQLLDGERDVPGIAQELWRRVHESEWELEEFSPGELPSQEILQDLIVDTLSKLRISALLVP